MNMMRNLISAGILIGLAGAGLGCTFLKRDARRYRDDTTAMLSVNNASLKACFDEVVKTTPAPAGTVVVDFKLKTETGEVFDVAVDADKSTAPEPVRDCVENSLSGLAIDPPDAVEGHASYTYEFSLAEGVVPVSGEPAKPAGKPTMQRMPEM